MSTKNTLKTGLLLAALTGVLAVAGHLVGGTTGLAIALLFGSGPTTFLGSVILGVLGAMAILYLLRRLGGTRYRI